MEGGWMGGRVVEGGSLENCCTREGTLGSNPSPSAFHLLGGKELVAAVGGQFKGAKML